MVAPDRKVIRNNSSLSGVADVRRASEEGIYPAVTAAADLAAIRRRLTCCWCLDSAGRR